MVSYPASLDVFTNPGAADPLNGTIPHHTYHTNHNAAIMALEAKLGIDASTPASNTVLTGTGTGHSSWQPVASSGVTSVGLADVSTNPIYSITNTPVTTTGSLTLTLAAQTGNTVFASPSGGGSGQPTFRSLVAADIPNLDTGKITTGTVATARLGSGTANSTTFLRGDQTYSSTLTGSFTQSGNGALSAPGVSLIGTWITGGTATTTKPYLLIEPAGTSSTHWTTGGTAFGINGDSLFTGFFVDFQLAGSSKFNVDVAGNIITAASASISSGALQYLGSGVSTVIYSGVLGANTASIKMDTTTPAVILRANSIDMVNIRSTGVGIKLTGQTAWLHIGAGTATAGQAPLKLTAGVNLTTPENGTFEYDGTHLYFTIGGIRNTLI